MSTIRLGKRKRSNREAVRPASGSSSDSDSKNDEEHGRIQEIFRQHFEAKFKPLPTSNDKKLIEDDGQDLEGSVDEDEWSGLSSTEENEVIEVYHTEASISPSKRDKDQWKTFMSSKPPSATSETLSTQKSDSSTKQGNDENDAQNMKNDIALQRLLAESHLLSGDASQGYDPKGKARLKALDLRFQALGSKESVFAQGNMPMNMRKGIHNKNRGREEKRRNDAKEAGIILEKVVKKKKDIGRRDRSIGAPAVGKFRSGLLTLSKKDIMDVQSRKGQRGRKGKRR